MQRIDGKEVAAAVKERLKGRIQDFISERGRAPGLAVVLVGEDPASQVYVGGKERACQAVGLQSFRHDLPATTSQEQLNALIEELNQEDRVDGILVQFPLPSGLSSQEVLARIDPAKDADGLTTENMGLHWSGSPRVVPCTPQGVMELLRHSEVELAGRQAVVVGRSHLVGQPIAQLLQTANATVTVCHSRTTNTSELLRQADIAVIAAGQPRLFGREDFKEGAVVIDVGIHRQDNGKLCGDVRFEELAGHVRAATPVPGGVGPMTIAMLLQNTVELAQLRS